MVAASGNGGDYVKLLSRGAGAATDFSSTRDAGNLTCSGGNSSSTPFATGLAVDPTLLSSEPAARVWLMDDITGRVRAVAKGTTLADPAGKIDPAVGGFAFTNRANPFPLVYFPGIAVQGIDRAGDIYALHSTSCNTTNYNYVQSTGIVATRAYTTSERLDYGWYDLDSIARGWSFARGKSDHFGYFMVGRPNSVIRGNDPELFVVPTKPTRVLISKRGLTDKYPLDCTGLPGQAPCQNSDRTFRFTVFSYVPAAVAPFLYLHLADPKDTAPYAPAPGAAPAGCDKSIPGPSPDPNLSPDACDNKGWQDASDDFGLTDPDAAGCPAYTPPAGKTKKWLCVANPGAGGFVSVNAKITGRYAGDNYQLRASFTNFIPGTVGYNPNYHIKGESGIVTAWKRVYVERDRMFRKGALLARNFNPATCGVGAEPGCNVVEVFDWGSSERLQINDVVTLFQTTRPFESSSAIIARVADERAGTYANTRLVQLSVNLKTIGLLWEASSVAPPSSPDIDFRLGKAAALGRTSHNGVACLVSTTNGPNACFYDTDSAKFTSAFADGEVEVSFPGTGEGAMPYLPRSYFDGNGLQSSLVSFYHFAWFTNNHQQPGTNINNPANYFHLMGASFAIDSLGNVVGGYSQSSQDALWIFVGNTEAQPLSASEKSDQIENDCTHELGHQFDLNYCVSGENPHDTRKAWCDTSNAGMPGCLPFAGPVNCLMKAISSTGPARFDSFDLLTGDPINDIRCTPDARLETAIRTHSDPL